MTPEQRLVSDHIAAAKQRYDTAINDTMRLAASAQINALHLLSTQLSAISPKAQTVHCDSCSCPLPTMQCLPVDDWPISEVTG